MSPILKCVVCAAIVLQGCNGGGGDEQRLRGVFLDSPVSGLRYATPTQQGLTDSEGAFFYSAGESVVFSIGELSFPSVTAAATITPLELAQADDIEDEQTVNLLRLLQTVDEDRNPENGINIPESAHDSVILPKFRFNGSLDVEQFLENIVEQVHADGRDLVSKEAAVDHFLNALVAQAGSDESVSEVVALTYLVESDDQYAGAFLSVQDAAYSLNLGDTWQQGSLDQIENVFRLKSVDGSSQFLTSGQNDSNQVVYCLGKRPYPVSACDADARLFVAFDDESEARLYNTSQEPTFEAAEEESPNGDSGDALVDGSNSGLGNESEPDSQLEQNTDTESQTEGVVNISTDNSVDENDSTSDNTANNTDTSTPVETDADNTDDEGTPQPSVITTTTNCPTGLRAPARFSVYANEPAGCQWDSFDNQVWTWNPAAGYDLTDNSVTASQGGVYTGEFSHSCTEPATGLQRTVTASCTVDVSNAYGVEDITDLFFVTGQSNASGLETGYDATLDAPDSRVFAYTDLGWQTADLHQYWEHSIPGNFSADDPSRSPYNSIAFQLSRAVAEQSDRVVGLVVLTAPGEGISHWDYNSEFSIKIRDKATAALNALPNKSSFDAMIWLQGETDWLLEGTADPGATGFTDTASEDYKNYYPNKLFQLINNLRGESWMKFDGRFICAETKKAALNPHLLALNQDADPLSGCAAASDLETRASDAFGNHFSAESLRILGKRLADVYLSMD